MSTIEMLEKNLELANYLPQVIDSVVRATVSRSTLVTSAFWYSIFKNLDFQQFETLKKGNDPNEILDKSEIKRNFDIVMEEKIDQETFNPAIESAIKGVNEDPKIKDIQVKINHQSVSLIATSFEAFCKEHFLEVNLIEASSNCLSIKSLYNLFSMHSKCLDTSIIFDQTTFEAKLKNDGVNVDSMKECFSYRHAIIHRAGIIDAVTVKELNLEESSIGDPVPYFTLEKIQEFAQSMRYAGYWIKNNAKIRS